MNLQDKILAEFDKEFPIIGGNKDGKGFPLHRLRRGIEETDKIENFLEQAIDSVAKEAYEEGKKEIQTLYHFQFCGAECREKCKALRDKPCDPQEPKERVEEPKESQGEKCTRTPKCSDCNDWKELGGYPIVCKECGWHQQQDAIVCCNPDCDAGVGDVRGKYIKVSPEVEAEIRKGAVWHEKEPDFIVNIPKNTKELKRVDIMKDGKLWGSVEKEPEKHKCDKECTRAFSNCPIPKWNLDLKKIREEPEKCECSINNCNEDCRCDNHMGHPHIPKPEPQQEWAERFDLEFRTGDKAWQPNYVLIKEFISNLLRSEKEKLITKIKEL